jgi:hypothetical protein
MEDQNLCNHEKHERHEKKIKERPILFSGEMVRAIIEGRKTQTRRVIKKTVDFTSQDKLPKNWIWAKHMLPDEDAEFIGVPACPYGQVGDKLWVRETWDVRFLEGVSEKQLCFRADMTSINCPDNFKGELNYNWRPSIFMPRWASRILLEVVSIRVERLQDISEEDAIAEGISKNMFPIDGLYFASQLFAELWNEINGKKHPWESNPWVWVVEFKRIDR